MNSLIIPIYKNEPFIPKVIEVCSWLNFQLKNSLEVVFVVDGSPDHSASLLKEALGSSAFDYQLIELSRNFGSFAAIRKGLECASGKYFAVMAADLQEPKELVLEFFKELEKEHFDVVVGSRESREDPLWSRLASKSFWWFYRKLIEPQMPKGGVDVFGCNETFRNHLLAMRESHSSLVGLVFWMGFRRKTLTYSRKEREFGRSAWTFSKKFRYMLDNIFSFTDLPVQVLTLFGFGGLALSFGVGSLILAAKITGMIPVPGYAATALLILFFASLNSLGLGIIGIYVWRTFENTKNRPESIVMEETKSNIRSEQWKSKSIPKPSASR